jgi:hypothetical protein
MAPDFASSCYAAIPLDQTLYMNYPSRDSTPNIANPFQIGIHHRNRDQEGRNESYAQAAQSSFIKIQVWIFVCQMPSNNGKYGGGI